MQNTVILVILIKQVNSYYFPLIFNVYESDIRELFNCIYSRLS